MPKAVEAMLSIALAFLTSFSSNSSEQGTVDNIIDFFKRSLTALLPVSSKILESRFFVKVTS